MPAMIELNYFSKALNTKTTVNVLLPEADKKAEGVAGAPEGEYKTLYLLHGMTDDRRGWSRHTNIDLYSRQHNVAVVMPEVGNSWYTDTAYGPKYLTFVGKELPEVCRSYFRGMSPRREMNFVAGNSMGGYGAVKVALTYPDRFFACAAFSGALDVTRKGRKLDWENWRGIFGFDLPNAEALAGTRHDLFFLAREAKEKGIALPAFYFWCGTEDGLIDNNRAYHAHLTALGIEHEYRESAGGHQWEMWDVQIQAALNFLL